MFMESLFTLGFPVALAWQNLGLCLLGALIGTLLGVLVGTGPAIAAVALLLLLPLNSSPSAAIAIIAGHLYGALYGASISAILFGVPDAPSAVATTFDGYPMANQGQAARALSATLVAWFLACTIATLFIAAVAARTFAFAPSLGLVENVALLSVSLALAVAFAGGSPPKALVMVLLGLLLAYIGHNPETGATRMTFDWEALADGLPAHAVTLGLVAFAAALTRFETAKMLRPRPVGPWLPHWSDLKQIARPTLRGGVVGTLLGLLPVGALLAPFVAYRLEKLFAMDRTRFGAGAIEGVAAPEAANNAAVQITLIPALTLGIPANAIVALMLGAMTIHGIVPGPQLATKEPNLFWGMIASMWIANLMVLALGLSLIGAWIKLLLLPRRLVLGALVLIGCLSVYAINYSFVDVGVAVFFGLVGYALRKRGFEPMPMLIGFLLGPALEEQLRRTLLISRGSFMIFVARPFSASLLLIALLTIAGAFWFWARSAFPKINVDEA
jgi:putative tricarboxylic transport membrane protein